MVGTGTVSATRRWTGRRSGSVGRTVIGARLGFMFIRRRGSSTTDSTTMTRWWRGVMATSRRPLWWREVTRSARTLRMKRKRMDRKRASGTTRRTLRRCCRRVWR
uniref:(northern house mosquito) hypothetical protein n=1 Tax=Culex pipiens TaxID=7175 RepID=A0A8D8A8X0_CULPI